MHRKNHQRPTQSARSILQQIAQVVHNPTRDRFELWVAGDLVGVLGYSSETVDGETTLTVLHTVLYDEYTGHGLGTGLTRSVITYARSQGAGYARCAPSPSTISTAIRGLFRSLLPESCSCLRAAPA